MRCTTGMSTRILVALVVSACTACASHPTPENTTIPPQVSLPLTFELNAGQIAEGYDFLARSASYDVAFHEGGVSFMLKDQAGAGASQIALMFPGAQPTRPRAQSPLRGRVNYLRGSDDGKWIRNVPTYERVRYPHIYPGIDLVFYGNDRQLEYDFVLAPHVDSSQIAFRFDGADIVRMNDDGDLVVSSEGRELIQKRPIAYQERKGVRSTVPASYAIGANHVVSMRVGPYDPTQPLTIDPMIILSRRFGGSGFDRANRVVAKAGALYLAGQACSLDFPVLRPVQPSHSGPNCDGFITKMTADGQSRVYSSYFGGSDTDYINGLDVDNSGAAYVTGYTASINFPTTAGVFDRTCGPDGRCRGTSPSTPIAGDGFVSKISPDGSTLVYSTYIGGTETEFINYVTVNSAGEALITGDSESPDYPTTPGAVSRVKNGFRDAVVTKLAANGGSLVYSTYFGGSGYTETGMAAAFDSAGSAWIVGQTDSTDMPVMGAFQPSLGNAFKAQISDAFIVRLTPSGALAFSSYFGGDSTDWATGVAVDPTGVYISGNSASTTTPGVAGSRDANAKSYAAFVSQLAADGSHVVKTHLFDGQSADTATAISIARPTSSPIIHVLGVTQSSDFPVTADAFQKTVADGGDLFYATLQVDAAGVMKAPTFATILGDSGFEAFSSLTTDGLDGAFVTTNVDGRFPMVNAPIEAKRIAIVHIVPPARWTESVPGEVHLYASDATTVGDDWSLVADPWAANGRCAANVNHDAPKVVTPASNPASYVEFTFDADAGTAYRLWTRGKAERDSYTNDSVYAQFSDSVDSAGNPLWRIGSSSATPLILEDCVGCNVHGWGWNDNGYGTGVLGPTVRFAATGRHTLRFQAREDGLSIDQVVLSSAQYLSAAPGLTKDDTTVLKRTAIAPTPPGDGCAAGEVVIHMTGTSNAHGTWGSTSDSTAASGVRMFQPDAGAAKITAAQASPANFFEKTFAADANTDYRLWIRGKAQNDFWGNDSVFAQFDDSVNGSGTAIWRIATTSGTEVNLEDCSGCGLKSWGWQDNGWGVGVLGPLVRFATSGTHTIRIQTREDGFSVDQIVLSSGKYLSAAPGSLKNDTTILPACATPPLR